MMTSGVMNVRDLVLLIIGMFTTFVDSTFQQTAQTFLRTAQKAAVLLMQRAVSYAHRSCRQTVEKATGFI